MKVFIILFSLVSSIYGAEDCGRVNLLRHKWTKLRQMPVYNQGITDLCYAYSATQLVDYWRLTYGPRITKSLSMSNAIYGALLSRIDGEDQNSLDVGHPDKVIEGIQKYGMCRSDVIEKSLKDFAEGNKIDPKVFQLVTQYFFATWTGNVGPQAPFDMRGSYVSGYERNVRNQLFRYLRGALDGKTLFQREKVEKFWRLSDLEKVYKVMRPYLSKNDYVGFLKTVFKDCFKPRGIYLKSKKLPPFEVVYVKKTYDLLKSYGEMGKEFVKGKIPLSKDLFYKRILGLLNKKEKPQPIGIAYCSGFLMDKKSVGLTPSGGMDESKCYAHASLIVGKRKRGNKCQFLIRDTRGEKCQYDWECLKDQKGRTLGLWVDSEAFMNNVFSLNYFKID